MHVQLHLSDQRVQRLLVHNATNCEDVAGNSNVATLCHQRRSSVHTLRGNVVVRHKRKADRATLLDPVANPDEVRERVSGRESNNQTTHMSHTASPEAPLEHALVADENGKALLRRCGRHPGRQVASVQPFHGVFTHKRHVLDAAADVHSERELGPGWQVRHKLSTIELEHRADMPAADHNERRAANSGLCEATSSGRDGNGSPEVLQPVIRRWDHPVVLQSIHNQVRVQTTRACGRRRHARTDLLKRPHDVAREVGGRTGTIRVHEWPGRRWQAIPPVNERAGTGVATLQHDAAGRRHLVVIVVA